jgi:hypothetical protein
MLEISEAKWVERGEDEDKIGEEGRVTHFVLEDSEQNAGNLVHNKGRKSGEISLMT